ncbi:MAG: DUF554 domain-containing protein [Clostridiales bacterium]|nr:DUF554 domain-containing protein [Clostridiales bacterium]MCF8022481.1 DUF554 domain-containing protein [Clostridiales bacterium]
MTGTVVNVIAIAVGVGLGSLFKKRIKETVKTTIMQGLGLSVLLIGLQMALQTEQIILVILSLVIGGIIGELLDIEEKLNNLGEVLEKITGEQGGSVINAFVSTSLIYCVGAMAIIGAVEDGLNNNPQILFAKSILDGTTAVFFTSTMGFGVIFSALSVLIYQGSITLLAVYIKDFLTPAVTAEITATGGILIVGIALNLLNIKQVKIGNLLPSVFVVLILTYYFKNYIDILI